MSTQNPDLFAALAAPFQPHEVKVRTQGGRQLHYITARTVMNRLDDVLGPENWFDDYLPGEKSVLCKLTIRLPDGTFLTKADAGGYAGMADSGDDDKSGYSDGFKRAAVKFGIARYLYRDGVPEFVQERCGTTPAGAGPSMDPERDSIQSEGRAEPRGNPQANSHANPPANAAPATPRNGNSSGNPPRTGKALFAWTKDQEQRYQVSLLKYLNQWAKLQDFPGRMVDWDGDQVSLAYHEAVRKLQSVQSGPEGGYEEALSN